ncbi:zinc ribbon domain-containing protein [Nocardia sp. 2]|uniref:Zinc ribbon domain-containing protein n=1 Tax=Nocardia acididurans TaxID=2802282 RepID=A0ABS1M7V8_9NOCA|nr:zinc ribbon domain-containing protein [Nocardia acididurans]MBL1076646.1 zinc ribbon domain-containing protein [Nocardia acididurans]
MPRYDFRCRDCGDFDGFHPLATVPDAVACPTCAQPARRRPGGGALLHGGTTAMRLLDSTARTASEPAVVAAPPPGARRPVSRNPLHRKLPRN